MVAVMFTAFSYGRMAARYPSAGSAYTYVGRGLGAHFGFLAGWAMLLDYLVNPLACTIYGSLTLTKMFPAVPYAFWALVFLSLVTVLNLRGVRTTARANIVLLAVMSVVIVAYVVLAMRYVIHADGWGGLLSYKPFYDPETFNLKDIATATSLAALTYIGFDGVTTLAEEVENPKRSVLVAVVLVCFITGILSTIEMYLAQLAWPDYTTFKDVETAFLEVLQRVGGAWLFHAMAAVMVVACVGSGLTAQAGAARLLYAMGREEVLPRRFFGHLSPRTSIPNYNMILVTVLVLATIPCVSYELAATVLNFGAFLGFMGVNLATIGEYYFRRREGKPGVVADLILPGLGFVFCSVIWLSLPLPAKIAGGAWLVVGVVYDAIKSRGFRVQPAEIDFGE
jgi:putrescine importer